MPNSSIRILAVDDRVENLTALEAAFIDTPYQLVTAGSGKEAITLAGDVDFAVILLDVQMPELDGYETARLIRKQERSKNTPIIFVTAIHRSKDQEQKGYLSGAVDFLFKPLDTEILLAKVAIFVELFKARLEIQRQAVLLQQQALKEQEVRLLQRAVDVRDEFLAIATHELNTPMTPLSLQMQSFLKLAREGRLHELDPVRLQRMLETAFGQVERVSRLIRELVDVSKISTGKLALLPSKVDLSEVTLGVLEAFHEEIHQRGVTVQLDAEPGVVGHWDRMRLEQVVINLLTNALKYGLGKPVTINIRKSDSLAYLTVNDRGIGVKSEDKQRIFERFERAVSPKNFGGLGIGLYITREIVDLHGGRIYVDSVPDRSTTFTVELPHGDASGLTV